MREILKGRCYSGYHFNIRKSYLEKLSLDENVVLLYRIRSSDSIAVSRIVKICRKSDGETRYILPLRMRILKELNLRPPCYIEIEILDMKPRGYKPDLLSLGRGIDAVSLIDNNSFTCIPYGKEVYLHWQGRNRGGRAYVPVPRHLIIDNYLLWNVGFYLAEGLKKNNNRISVANSEWNLIERFLVFLKKYLGVEDRSLYLYIRLDDEKKNAGAVRFWSEKLGLEKTQIKTSKVGLRPPKSEHGNAELVLYNTALSRFFMSLFDMVISLDTGKEESLSLIRGIEAGDGYVMEHGGIEIGVVSDKEFSGVVFNLFKKVYPGVRIRDHHTSENAKIIFYKGRKNAITFLLDGHFSEHERIRARLIELLRYYFRREIRYMALVDGKSPVREIAKKAGVNFGAANVMLKRLENEGFLEKGHSYIMGRRAAREYRIRIFKLTETGDKLLKYLVN